VAEMMALRQGGGFVYTIDPSGLDTIDVNSELGSESPYPDEQEITVTKGGIPYENILGWRSVP
jgi:hypothetical protein